MLDPTDYSTTHRSEFASSSYTTDSDGFGTYRCYFAVFQQWTYRLLRTSNISQFQLVLPNSHQNSLASVTFIRALKMHATLKLALALSILAVAAAGEGHDHGGTKAFEWGGIFDTPEKSYTWAAQAVGKGDDRKYVDPSMTMVAYGFDAAATKADFELMEDDANTALEGSCAEVLPGSTILADGNCYKLMFINSTLDTTFTVDTKAHKAVAFFTQHLPTEFERTEHYFKDVAGTDVEPVFQEPDPSAEEEEKKAKPWGTAIGAAIIVNIVTLTGVVLTMPAVAKAVATYPQAFEVSCNGFVAGALLAAAFYLLLHEATHLITADTEALASARWGTMILLGFLTAFLCDSVVAAVLPARADETPTKSPDAIQQPVMMVPAAQMPEPMQTGEVVMGSAFGGDVFMMAIEEPGASIETQRRVFTGIILGDFMHNFCDGIFIGSAFALCGNTMGWSVTAATVYHEIAQEISDFVVLTDPKQGALKPLMALGFNFASGLSVLLGVLVILSQDLSNLDTGMILAYGGGIYLQIAASECMPRIYKAATSVQLRFIGIFAFFLGALAIGLVLLDHKHCEAGGGHEGHNHGGH